MTKCPSCFILIEKRKLASHLRDCHIENEAFICDFCGDMCSSFRTFQSHIKAHLDKMPSFCSVAKRQFTLTEMESEQLPTITQEKTTDCPEMDFSQEEPPMNQDLLEITSIFN